MEREPDFIDKYYKDKDLSLLKKQTLIIPTYNRNFYLSRCLWYHAHFPFGQIIVADSSPEKIKTVNKDTIQKIRKTFERNILYLEYEPETEPYGGDIYRKWGDAVQHAIYEYSEICTDKEFLIPTICCESIIFLSENPDYINAFGGRSDCINYFNKKLLTQTFRPQLENNNSPLERFRELKRIQVNYENLFQIYRTPDLKIIWKNIIDYSINDLRFGEIAAEYQPLFMGKIRFINDTGRIRDLTTMKQKKNYINNKSESSSLRYPYLLEYPKKYLNKLQNNLTECLYNHLTHDLQNDENKQTIHSTSSQMVITWMGKEPTSKYYLFVGKIKPLWNILPKAIKKWSLKYFKKGIFTNSDILDRNKLEFKIIIKTISEFPKILGEIFQ